MEWCDERRRRFVMERKEQGKYPWPLIDFCSASQHNKLFAHLRAVEVT